MPFRSPTSSPSPSGSGSWSSSTLTATQTSQTSPRAPFSFPLPPPMPDQTPQTPHSTRRAPSAASTILHSGRLAADATSSQLGLNSSTDNDTATTTNVMDGNANGYITPDTSISATLAPMTSSGSSAPLSLSPRPLLRSKSKSRRHSTAKDRPVSTHTRASTYVAPAHDVQFRLLRRSGASNSSFLMVTSYLSGIQERANTLREVNRKRTKLKKKRPEGWVSEKEQEAMKKERKELEKVEKTEKRISTMPKLKEEQEKEKETEDANTNVKEDGMERWMGMVTGKKEKGKGKMKEGLSRAKSESDARRESALTSRTDINTTNAPILPTPKVKPATTMRKPIILDTPSPSRSNTVTSHSKRVKGKGKARRGRCSSTICPASTLTNGQKPRSRSVFSGYLNHLLSSFPRLSRLRRRVSTAKSSTQPPAYPRLPKGPSTPNMLLRGRHFTEKYIPRFPSRQFLSGVHTLQAEVQSQSGHGHPDAAGPSGRSSTYNGATSGSGSARAQEKPRSRLSEQGHERASSSGHEKLSSHGHGRSQSYSAYAASSSPATSKTYVNGHAIEQTQAYTSASSAILSVPAPAARSRPSSYSPPYSSPREDSKSSVAFNVPTRANNKQAKEADTEPLSRVGRASSSTDHSVSTAHSPSSSRHGHERSRPYYYGQSSSSSSTSTAALSYATAQSSTAALSYMESQSAAHAHSRPLSG